MLRLLQRLPAHPGLIVAGLLLLNAALAAPALALPVRPFTADSGWREPFTFLWLGADLWLTIGWLWIAGRAGRLNGGILVAVAFWLLALATEVYDVFIIATFSRPAVLYNDLLLVPDALNLALDLAPGWWPVAAVAALVVAAAVGLIGHGLIAAGLRGITRPRRLAVGMGVAALFLGAAHLERGLAARDNVAQSSLVRLGSNVAESIAMARTLAAVAGAPGPDPALADTLARVRLVDPPSLVVIQIESYGSVLYSDPNLEHGFAASRDGLGAGLAAAGWQVTTAFSDSPVRGGTSWLASATLLSGLELDNQHLYQRFISQPGATLPAFFAAQGYRTVTVQPANRERPGRPLGNPYGFDRVWFRRELDYYGPAYGWGVVPDQYSLNRAVAALAPGDAPTFIYAVTVSSHAPWDELPPLAADWRTLAEREGSEPGLAARVSAKLEARFGGGEGGGGSAAYLAAIAYELAVLERLIVELAPDHPLADAVFLVLGDHQPPFFETGADVSTPVHVISRDPGLLAELASFGFNPGLDGPTPAGSHLRHAGLFSLLAGAFAARYGSSDVTPPYQATGAPLSVLFSRRAP